MSAAYDAGAWESFFVGSAGASAALAGLVFVAVSINVERILQYTGLPERALATVVLLLSVVLVSLVALFPGQGSTALGLELLAVGLATLALIGALLRRQGDDRHERRTSVRVTMPAGTVPYVIGAVSVLAGTGGGLYWVAAGMLAAIAGGVVNAWVLLVEILR